ncbi:hypothetical protein D3C81_2088480 [compost metagenome]
MVFIAVQCAAVSSQCCRHGGIARDRLRFVIVIAEHRVYAQLGCQLRNPLLRPCVAHDQAAAQFA